MLTKDSYKRYLKKKISKGKIRNAWIIKIASFVAIITIILFSVFQENKLVSAWETLHSLIENILDINLEMKDPVSEVHQEVCHGNIVVRLEEVAMSQNQLLISVIVNNQNQNNKNLSLRPELIINDCPIIKQEVYGNAVSTSRLNDYQVLSWRFGDEVEIRKENKIKLVFHPDESTLEDFIFSFTIKEEEIQSEMYMKSIDQEIGIKNAVQINLKEFRKNLAGNEILGICNQLPTELYEYSLNYMLIIRNQAGEETEFVLKNYTMPEIQFISSARDVLKLHTGEIVNVQLCVCGFYSNNDIDFDDYDDNNNAEQDYLNKADTAARKLGELISKKQLQSGAPIALGESVEIEL